MARQRPEDKVKMAQSLKDEEGGRGRSGKVLMVWDGLNDAAASIEVLGMNCRVASIT